MFLMIGQYLIRISFLYFYVIRLDFDFLDLDFFLIRNLRRFKLIIPGDRDHSADGNNNNLNNHLQQRWIGRDGPIQCPPRSLDLTICDFWFWSYIVYKPPKPVSL